MRIKSFSELDQVLKNSFSTIKKELLEIKKGENKRRGDLKKQLLSSDSVLDTKIKFLTNEIKSLKDNSIKTLNHVSKLDNLWDNSQKSLKQEFKVLADKYDQITDNKISDRMDKVDKEILELKSNIQKLVASIQDKIVTKKTFETRNKYFEDALRELLALKQSFEDFKNSTATRQDLQKAVGMQDETKEELSMVKDSVNEVSKLTGELRHLKDDVMTLKNKDYPLEMEQMRKDMSEKLSVFDTLKRSIEAVENAVKDLEGIKDSVNVNHLNEEMQKLSEKLALIENDLKVKLDRVDNLESQSDTFVPKSVFDRELQDMSKKLEESSLQKQDSVSNEIRQEISSLKSENENTLEQELSEIRKVLENLEKDVSSNSVKIDMIQKTKATVKPKFHMDEVHQPVVEPLPKKSKPVSETPVDRTGNDVVNQVEASITGQDTDYSFSSEPEVTVMSKLKKGITNFFFEEVEEEEPQIYTQAEPVVVEQQIEEKKKPKEFKKPKKIEPKGPEKKEEESSGKGYMRSRKPRIFDEIEPEEEGSRKKKYKRVDKNSGEEFSDEKVLYPEDYFY